MLRQKMFQDMKQNKLQFLSILLMAFLGVFIFTGVGGEWAGVYHYRTQYYEETNLADGWIWGENFNDNDVDSVQQIDGVIAAEKRFYCEVTGKDEDSPVLYFYGLNTNDICKPYLIEGDDFDVNASGKMWLDKNFAEAKGLTLGDSYTMDFQGTEFTLTIAGLIYSSEYQYYSNENDLWPDYHHIGFVYAPISSVPIKEYIINYIKKSDKSVAELVEEFGKENAELLEYKKMLSGFSKDFIVKQLEKADRSEFEELIPYTQIIIKSSVPAADLSDKIDETLKDHYAVYTTRAETAGIQMLDAEMNQHKMVGSLFPILFLSIAILAIITSMNRLINSQRTQIGTLKALGFSNTKITLHYMNYGLWMSLIGAVLGFILGPFSLPPLFYSSMSSYFALPEWKPGWDISFVLVAVGTVLACTLATLFSAKELLGGTPAETLRPKAPKKLKLTRLEKSKLWRRLGFHFRWSYRSVIRGKMKTVMGIAGTVGCMALLICAFSCLDSMNDMEHWMYSEIQVQETRLMLDSETDIAAAEQIAAEVDGEIIMTDAIEIKAGGKKKTGNITVTDGEGCFYITDTNRRQLTPDDSTVALSEKMAQLLGVKQGDEIAWHIYTSDKWVTSTVTILNKTPMTQGMVITRNTLEGYGYEFKPNYVDTLKAIPDYTNEHVSKSLTADDMMNFWDNYMETMYLMVGVLILFACLLSIVVLYNLGSLTYTESERENATLKVLGFKTNQIMKTNLIQNLMLSVIGIILGTPLGLWFVYIMLNYSGDEFDMMISLSKISFLICTAITIGVSMLVSLMFKRRIKRLDMVESLKGVE